ncbi:MAG: PEGA domain-containing protein [Planctomycetes bacterium]|nr:PEGA domain-containing protein [Planctomycetota bacterium]
MSANQAALVRFVSSSRAALLRRAGLALLAGILLPVFSGCTGRGMTITTLPAGAEVSINHRVVGVTPIRVGYTHYGAYRIELRKERYETLVKEEKINPPWYGYDPITALADNAIPVRFNDEIFLHYVLKPIEEVNRDSLMERANAARDGKAVNPRNQEKLEVVFTTQAVSKNAPETSIGPKSAPSPAAPLVGPAAAPNLNIPKEGTPSGEEKPPEGPKTEPGPGETKPLAQPAQPAPATPAKTPEKTPEKAPAAETEPQTKRMRRTPKGEVLIYEDQPVEEPGAKEKEKRKEEEKKAEEKK